VVVHGLVCRAVVAAFLHVNSILRCWRNEAIGWRFPQSLDTKNIPEVWRLGEG
jgi:hypothetical protein